MKNNRKHIRKNNRRSYGKKRERHRGQKAGWIMKGIAVAIFLLFLYLAVTLHVLWKETVKYDNKNETIGQIGQALAVQQGTNGTENGDSIGNNTGENKNRELAAIKRKIQCFAVRHDISMGQYPEELIELMGKNPETEEFVLNYPLKKETYSKEPLHEHLNKEEIPLLMQWDSRWGYYAYGGKVIGMTGCGPTCLSMVAIHLLQNPTLTPIYMADYAQKNGYYVQGTGTSWEFMSHGASALGLRARELPLDENTIKQYLQNGNPIICVMGKGDFTDTGHFIVLAGVEDGKIKVNDPNSRERSEKLWEFEDIKYQIKNLWVYWKAK
uniref:C39 family peptidase n=1 Tax=Agathobacter sp. TaxID=2021311 RepID=UPI004057AFD1